MMKARRSDALSELIRELAATPIVGEQWGSALAPGQRIGRFELIRELGRGGFGIVYEALDTEIGRSVAFKAVRPGQPRLGGQQLLREADAIAKLSHPNLVTLHDVGRCEHGPYLVLELLRGMTLATRLGHGPMGTGEALRVAIEVTRALEYAHGQGVVHRDLKPSNVFLCEGGLVKVLDFGMAHAFGLERISGGTPSYMAPEQARGAPEDERTDIFALGVILYRLLTGELPFGEEGKGLESSRAAPLLDTPAAPALGPFVARMLEKDPVKRPRRAAEAVAALTSFHEELERTGTTGTAARVRRRRRRVWGVAALLAAGAILGAGASTLVSRHPLASSERRDLPCVAVLPLASLSASPEDQLFAEGIHGELITQLAKISGLRVIARSSVEQYQAGARDLEAISRALGAGTILEGTVQSEGSRVRIAVHLVDPHSRREVWADRYDRDREDVFAVQTEVALEVARALGAKLSAAERHLVERPPTHDPQAHDLFLRAIRYWERSMDVLSDNRQAEALLEAALHRDPSFALAHSWLAIVKDGLDDCPGGRLHAERALALQPDLPQAHAALADVQWNCDHDALAAVGELEIAVRDAPGDAVARASLGNLLTLVGRFDEGLSQLRTALAIDPRSYFVAAELAQELTLVRRFDEAARVCEKAQELSPADVNALAMCALIPVWRDGDTRRAQEEAAALPRELPTRGLGAWSVLQLFAFVPSRALELADAGALRDPYSTDPLIPRAFVVGAAHAALGRAGRARAEFARALAPLEAKVASEPDDALARLLLARTYAGVGRADDAIRECRRAISETKEVERKATALRFAADAAAAAGRRDEAFEWLGTVLARRDGLLTAASVRVDPRFLSLRRDPRFAALVAATSAQAAR